MEAQDCDLHIDWLYHLSSWSWFVTLSVQAKVSETVRAQLTTERSCKTTLRTQINSLHDSSLHLSAHATVLGNHLVVDKKKV